MREDWGEEPEPCGTCGGDETCGAENSNTLCAACAAWCDAEGERLASAPKSCTVQEAKVDEDHE